MTKLNLKRLQSAREALDREDEQRDRDCREKEDRERRRKEYEEREAKRNETEWHETARPPLYGPNRDRGLNVTHSFPSEEEYLNTRAAFQNKAYPLRVDEGVAGIVERVSSAEYDSNKPKRAAVGYVMKANRIGDNVKTYFSKEWPLHIFDLNNGAMGSEPHGTEAELMFVNLSNYPMPVFHRTYTPHDTAKPDNAFEPHVRNLVGGRINRMKKFGSNADIAPYQTASEKFLNEVKELFKKAGQY